MRGHFRMLENARGKTVIKEPLALSSGKITYERKKSAEWIERQINSDLVVMDYNFFQCVHWISGDLRPILYQLIEEIEKETDSAKTEELLEKLHEAEDWSANNLLRDFEDIVSDYPYVTETLKDCVKNACKNVINTPCDSEQNSCVQARKQIAKTFDLSPIALDMLEFVYIVQTNSALKRYLEDTLEIWKSNRRNILACIMNASTTMLKEIIIELTSCGILEFEPGRYYQVSDDVMPIWESPDTYDENQLFCTSLKGDILPLDKFRVPEEDIEYVKNLLTSKGNKPVHIMLYGSHGTGKTTFARSLASNLNLKTWSVNSRDDDDEKSRRASLTACLNLSRKHKDSFVLVDEAERMLDTRASIFGGSRNKDKAWLNALLEKPDNRVIWISNDISHIDPAVRRRFSFSIHFDDLGKSERLTLWREIIANHKMGKYVTEEQIQALAEDYEVPAAVMDTAISQAKSLGYKRADFINAVKCSLGAYSVFINNGKKKIMRNTSQAKGFNPDGTTLEGSLENLMERCFRADAAMRKFKDDKQELEGGCATMLFYGPPGTGKTALARHIAHKLDRECIVKRASDLMSCFVGGTEKNIASAFYNSERDGAVLVIDEADTFLYSRDIAQRSWETSQVNEFLTQLEECRCFCICTTNRLNGLDEAALRRFSYKVAFTWAKPQQIIALYNSLLAPLCKEKLTPELERELTGLTRLAPGDFHTVRSQYNSFLSDEASATHEDMITALKREEALKARYISRNAGF